MKKNDMKFLNVFFLIYNFLFNFPKYLNLFSNFFMFCLFIMLF